MKLQHYSTARFSMLALIMMTGLEITPMKRTVLEPIMGLTSISDKCTIKYSLKMNSKLMPWSKIKAKSTKFNTL